MVTRRHRTAAAATLLGAVLVLPQAQAARFDAPDEAALIDAMEQAASGAGPDVIMLEPGRTYELDSEYSEGLALPRVTGELRIQGNGATLRWTGENTTATGFLHVTESASLEVVHLTLEDSTDTAIVVDGRLTLRRSELRNNETGLEHGGGAIRVTQGGRARIFRSLFDSNQATFRTLGFSCSREEMGGHGGAVRNEGKLRVAGATFIRNRTLFAKQAGHGPVSGKIIGQCGGSGAHIFNAGRAKVTNAVFDSDSVGSGASVVNVGRMTIRNATALHADFQNWAGTFRVANSIIGRCRGIRSAGHNVATETCRSLDHESDRLVSVLDPGLAFTRREVAGLPLPFPAADGPLIDSADPELCPSRDAPGRKRPLDGDHDGTARCDVGAVELDPGSYEVDGRVVGLWFEPERDGHYLLVEQPQSGRLVVFWATYDGAGNPMWLFGGGEVEGSQLHTDLTLQRGMRFGAFDRTELSVERWGELEVTFTGCGQAGMRWLSTSDPSLNGEAELTRLAEAQGKECTR